MSCDLDAAQAPQVQAMDLPDGVPPLTTFYLYLTSSCNLRCRHCWVAPAQANGQPRPGDCLDPGLLRQAVRQARPLGLDSAKLTGGEPVLHPQFAAIVDFLTAEGLRLNMETNATLIDASLARHLKNQSTLAFVSVSLDGPNPQVHDPFRGVKGSFEAAVRGFRCLVEAGYRPQVIASVHRGNIQYIEDMVRLALDLGAGSVKFNPVSSTGRGMAMRDRGETLDIAEIVALARFVRGDLQRRVPIRLVLKTPPALYTVGELARLADDGVCHIRHILGILGSGDMALCGIGQTVPDLCFGSLGRVSVAEVWCSHPVLKQLRRDLAGDYPGLCGRCIHAGRCLTDCAAQNYLETGRLVSPSMLCTAALERGIFPLTRLREAS